jgi:hypothetical protein
MIKKKRGQTMGKEIGKCAGEKAFLPVFVKVSQVGLINL